MYHFSFRALLMALCMFVAGLLFQGCTYDSYFSLAGASLLFGIMSSAITFFSMTPRLRPFCQKVGLFSFLMNTFVILILWKWMPGFHLLGSSTAVWMSLFITVIAAAIQLFSFYDHLRSSPQKSKVKIAKAKVISSKKNSLQSFESEL